MIDQARILAALREDAWDTFAGEVAADVEETPADAVLELIGQAEARYTFGEDGDGLMAALREDAAERVAAGELGADVLEWLGVHAAPGRRYWRSLFEVTTTMRGGRPVRWIVAAIDCDQAVALLQTETALMGAWDGPVDVRPLERMALITVDVPRRVGPVCRHGGHE